MISAIILAAGRSKRMGSPKLVLRWGETTVIGKVIDTLVKAGINDLHVVTGGNHRELEKALSGYQVDFIFNPLFANGDMMTSIQLGLKGLPDNSDGALIVLGDQPQIEAKTVDLLIQGYLNTKQKIIVPSYKMHRGHPILIDRSLHSLILELHSPKTLKVFLNANQALIYHVNVDSSTILEDVDTPADYYQFRPG